MENGLLSLGEMLHGVHWDVKYAIWDNFAGKPVNGYEVNYIISTKTVAFALREAQIHAAALGYGLLSWDGYRPRTAVDYFLHWAAQPENNLTREKFYPNIKRAELITKGYMASQSNHSRGNTIDLTLYHLDTGEFVLMEGNFDFMDERSHHTAKGIGDAEAQNRRYLRRIMESSGFQSYRSEWWRYKLIDEPYPDIYFNFAVS